MTHDELAALVNRSLFAEIGYTDEQGRQNIRKVYCVWHKGLGRHLISTNTSSAHVQSLLHNSNACLYFSDDAKFEGLCLYGRAEIRTERAYKELLWNPGDEKYYPQGIDDPDYCVIEFIADAGRFYRFDGKGTLSAETLAASSAGREYENGYAASMQSVAES
ncbi:MAG: pyridoxamine 5'-phosphate oxidase family protein [Oscillospiraceae bacterium]|nr:pyridoxamine 5'-phosphate oxidase family protein [Oscillospiraceae bacterium]